MNKYPIIILGIKPFLPHNSQSITIGKKTSVNSVKFATQFNDNKISVAFIKPEFDITKIHEFTIENIYETGLLCTIDKDTQNESSNITITGYDRIKITTLELDKQLERYVCEYEEFETTPTHSFLSHEILSIIQNNINPLKELTGDYYTSIKSILSNQFITFNEKIFSICNKLLTNTSLIFDKPIEEIITFLIENISKIINSIKFKISLEEKTKERIQSRQYKLWAQEQMSILQNEVNDNADALKKQILEAKLPPNVERIALEEYEKLAEMPSYSSESAIIRNYIKWILAIPWNISSTNKNSIEDAKRILDESHFGMKKTKERILDFIALEHRNKDASPATILLHGLPGTGKTSIAQSIAKALGRKFIRISLAGLSDSNKLRGQSRTYVGASPGDIIRKLKIAQTNNPVIQLDEIDKINTSDKNPMQVFHEILDPDFRKAFEDNYLDIPVDLTKVLFVATANDLSAIPSTILDRCKIIAVDSYDEEEKLQICKNFIIPKKFKEHHIKENEIAFTEESIRRIITSYTKEAGVRQLSEHIQTIIAKALIKIERKECISLVIDKKFLDESFPYNIPRDLPTKNYVGIIRGLAYSQQGGSIMPIEVTSYTTEASATVVCGHLGQSMSESFKNALGYIRHNAKKLGIDSSFFTNRTFHINTWGAATPKDGPSAGCAITTAIISHCLNLEIPNNIAITGEISLSGHSLLVGGIKEKCNGAYSDISLYTDAKPIVFLPHNIPIYMTENVIGVDIIRVEHIREIWQYIWPNINLFKNI